MAIAITLKDYLSSHGVHYDLVSHAHTESSLETAQAAHISGDKLIKSVMLQDENGLLMAVLPATHRVELGTLHVETQRNLGLATEMEFKSLLSDCELGAIPPVGPAYGIETIMDACIEEMSDLYFEAGDHKDLVHMDKDQYMMLMAQAERLQFTHHR